MLRFGTGYGLSMAPIAAVVMLAGISGALAQPAPVLPADEDARLALIDYCVIETGRSSSQHDNITAGCRCTVNAVMPQLTQPEMQGIAKWRKPTSAVKRRWDEAVAACK